MNAEEDLEKIMKATGKKNIYGGKDSTEKEASRGCTKESPGEPEQPPAMSHTCS